MLLVWMLNTGRGCRAPRSSNPFLEERSAWYEGMERNGSRVHSQNMMKKSDSMDVAGCVARRMSERKLF